jgi:hypothetical protein
MTQLQQQIINVVNIALNNFNQNERYLIEKDLSERCICSKFATYLEKALCNTELSEYMVDVEYNRGSQGNEYAAKQLGDRKIVVDLIAHKRGYDTEIGFDNLFCIEMKKEYKKPDLTSDKERLKIMTDRYSGFGYKAGFMILARANKRESRFELFIESTYLYPSNQ